MRPAAVLAQPLRCFFMQVLNKQKTERLGIATEIALLVRKPRKLVALRTKSVVHFDRQLVRDAFRQFLVLLVLLASSFSSLARRRGL